MSRFFISLHIMLTDDYFVFDLVHVLLHIVEDFVFESFHLFVIEDSAVTVPINFYGIHVSKGTHPLPGNRHKTRNEQET